MKRTLKNLASKVADRIGQRVGEVALTDDLAYRVALESCLVDRDLNASPHVLFRGVSDGFWRWLFTEGCRRNRAVRKVLPGVPDDEVQLTFTGSKGDHNLNEAFAHYQFFRDLFEEHIGPIERCERILDFGCGWGRIIRFFMKDVNPAVLWGADPVPSMIEICKRDVKWCNFDLIGTAPPTPYSDNTFDFVYSFSVFSHLSEERHMRLVSELHRILKPGGLLIATTRPREFIVECAELRGRQDLDSIHFARRVSAEAFPDTAKSLADYDQGLYCFTQLVKEGEWSYWGDTAIPEAYVSKHWTKHGFELVDFVADVRRCPQNAILVRKTEALPAAGVN